MAEQQLRNVIGHVVIQSEFVPEALLRNATGHVVIQRNVEIEPPPGEGGEAVAPRRLSSGLGIGI